MKIAFTICSTNYLPFAKALGDTFMQHNSDYAFSIVLIDTLPSGEVSFFEPHPIIEITKLGLPEFDEMNNKYNIFELSCALKPYVIEYFIRHNPSAEVIAYFDSDILVYNKLTLCEYALKKHPVTLTPHINISLDEDGHFPNEEILLKAGLFNAGFIAVNNSKEAKEFIGWWKKKLLTKCFNDTQKGLFVDQLWLSFVPVFFPSSCILNNPGYNVAYWNFQERDLSFSNTFTINNDHPLVFFHFSGYDINTPEIISKYQDRFSFENKPEFRPLFDEYRSRIIENLYHNFKDIKPAFGFIKEEIQPVKKNFFQKIFNK